jgi:hypothetical protein
MVNVAYDYKAGVMFSTAFTVPSSLSSVMALGQIYNLVVASDHILSLSLSSFYSAT